MAYEISHFSCWHSPLPDLSAFSVLFLCVLFVNQSSLSWERISKGSLELFGVWNRIIIVRMVDQRIVLLDPPELCVPCTTVLWVLLVEGASPMVPVRARRRLHNPQSGLSSCWSSSKLTRRSSSASRTSSQVSTGPYLFTKVQRTLTKHWRRQGIRIFTYLDDGAGADSSFQEAQEVSDLVRRDVKLSGFVANEIKSQWIPAQRGELLGFVLDLSAGTFQVPQRRVDSFCVLLETVVSKGFVASARQLSRFTGLLASMGLALGPVVWLWTHSLYRNIFRSASWDSPFRMLDDAVCEVLFWQDNFNNSGYPIWSPSLKPEVLSFSDASESGWGGFTAQVGGKVAVGSWSLEEMGRSSTFRELRATRRVLEALAPHLKGSEVLHRTDNKNTEIILSIGSRQADLHDEAVSVYKLCRAYDIRLTVEWVSRDYNVVADELSRIEDENDYMLDRSCFMSLDSLWGPHLVDRFASEKTKQLDRFCSRFLNPGCEAADAFTVSWTGVNNWLFPPPFLVPRVLRHMSVGKEDGTLLVPEWRSAPWWPLLVTRRGRWREFVVDSRQIQPYEGIFVPGSAASSIFSSGTPAFSLLALKLKFSSTSAPINTPSVAAFAGDEDASAVLASHGPACLLSSR